MKIEINKDMVGNASVDSVWSALTDFSRESEYWTNIRDVRIIEESGNTLTREAVVGPRGFGMKTLQKLRFDLGSSFNISITGDSVRGRRDISLSPEPDGRTRVKLVWELDILDAPEFVQGIVKKQLDKASEKALKRVFEDASR